MRQSRRNADAVVGLLQRVALGFQLEPQRLSTKKVAFWKASCVKLVICVGQGSICPTYS